MNPLTTIWEEFELPSKGKIYDVEVPPTVRLRSMTTAEELRRLSPTDTPYKVLSDIITDCMEVKPKLPVSEFCLGDYQFLLYKLRIVTHGSDYRMVVKCPECGQITENVVNMDTMQTVYWEDDANEARKITLPMSQDEIELNFLTPHAMDLMTYRAKERRKQEKNGLDYGLLYKLAAEIKTVNGMKLTDSELIKYVEQLPARDGNYIITKCDELNGRVGVDNVVTTTCASCGKVIEAPFRVTAEFFRPTVD